MANNEMVSGLLASTGGFRDLDTPVIGTGGDLLIYFINTEKVCQDDGAFKEYGDDSAAMIRHAIAMEDEHPSFGEVITHLESRVREIIAPHIESGTPVSIAGGQRRDWVFSGPVAHRLGLSHISLYKQGEGPDKVEQVSPDGRTVLDPDPDLTGSYSVIVSDLLTVGSSQYTTDRGKERGWVPMLRDRNAIVDNLVVVVDRLQGAAANLGKVGVQVHSEVEIDNDFLGTHSNTRAIAYTSMGEVEWTKEYLRDHGALAVLNAFDPEWDKVVRARRFFEKYGGHLEEVGKLGELQEAVQETYGKSIQEIIGGK